MAAAVSPFVRLRDAGIEQRQQIKWFAYAVGVLIVGRLLSTPTTEAVGGGWIPSIGFGIYVIGIVGVPLAVGIAVLRHRLYDIDHIIRRTLVYGSLTVLLAAVYFGSVAFTGAVFQALTLREDPPQFVIVAITLAIAALFNPLRRRIQRFIDRRFFRSRYDANKVLETFAVRLRDETDLDRLTRELVGVVGQTMQPAHLSLWLRAGADSRGRRAE
jgi:small basic protein